MVTPTLCTIRIWHRHTLHMSHISAECDLRSRKYQRSTQHQHADPFALYSLARTARSEPPGRATHRSQPVAAQHFFTCTTKRMYELVRRRTARRNPWRTGVLLAVSKSMQCVEFWLPAPICTCSQSPLQRGRDLLAEELRWHATACCLPRPSLRDFTESISLSAGSCHRLSRPLYHPCIRHACFGVGGLLHGNTRRNIAVQELVIDSTDVPNWGKWTKACPLWRRMLLMLWFGTTARAFIQVAFTRFQVSLEKTMWCRCRANVKE